MIAAGNRRQSRGASFSPRQSPAAINPSATGTVAGHKSGGCCKGINDCVMGSIVSTRQKSIRQQPEPAKLEQQVAELEREVLKQKELRIMYRKRMEKTQGYLRYCLQVAEDNGFLDVIARNKYDESAEFPRSSSGNVIANNSPLTPALLPHIHQHPDLALLISQAATNGWCIRPHEIELQEKIGQGSTAEIFKAAWRGMDVAVKCLSPRFFAANENGVAFFAQELDTLSKQRHRFILQFMGACLDPPDKAWIVTELLGMTLKDWIHGPGRRRKKRSIPLPPFKDRISKALEIALALQYLHEQKPRIIHRDLKPSNIFLDDCNHVKIADFGHARFLNEEEMALTGETGTYVYMAPEVIRCEPYNEKCDVYSFGIILNELITGDHPYIEVDSGPSKIAMEVAKGKLRPKLPENREQLVELMDLISNSWNQDATIRPSFANITSFLRRFLEQGITDESPL